MLLKCMLDISARVTRTKLLVHEDRILSTVFILILFRCSMPDTGKSSSCVKLVLSMSPEAERIGA